jgi:hypothetical protein
MKKNSFGAMAIGTKVNFDNIYPLDNVSDDLRITFFQTPLQSGISVSLIIKISEESHELLPNVYNLAFGPLNKRGQIDDKTELPHSDYSKVPLIRIAI